MSEKKVYGALSSASRLEILKLVQKKSLSVEEIAELVNLQPITVRHHLHSLQDAGLIESHEEKVGTVGRPKVYYQIVKDPTIVSYPKRGYLTLSNFMIRTLHSFIGSKRAGELLRRVGKSMGKKAIRDITSKHDIEDWSREDFINFFVKGYLSEVGAYPEIVETDKHRIVYRVHNCIFRELAVKMPETICDVLHEAFHEGVSSALDEKVKITRLTCQGHGDACCEHECEWKDSSQ